MDRRWVLRWILIAALPLQVSSCEELGPQTPAGPFAVVVHPSGEHLYVAGARFTSSVWIADAGINQLVGSIPIPNPVELAISPSGTLYVADGQDDTVYAIETTTHTVVNRVEIKPEDGSTAFVNGMGLNGTGIRLYIAEGGSLLVYDAQNLQRLGSIPRSGTTDVASAPYLDEAYVLSYFNEHVLIVRDVEELAEIKLPAAGDEIAAHPSGTLAYVTDSANKRIFVVDIGRRAVVSTILLPDEPVDLAVHPAATVLYVISADAVTAVNLPAGTIRSTQTIGGTLGGIAIHPSGTHLYVSDYSEHVVHVLDASTLSTTAVIQPP